MFETDRVGECPECGGDILKVAGLPIPACQKCGYSDPEARLEYHASGGGGY